MAIKGSGSKTGVKKPHYVFTWEVKTHRHAKWSHCWAFRPALQDKEKKSNTEAGNHLQNCNSFKELTKTFYAPIWDSKEKYYVAFFFFFLNSIYTFNGAYFKIIATPDCYNYINRIVYKCNSSKSDRLKLFTDITRETPKNTTRLY